MGAALLLVCWGLVALGIVLLVAAVMLVGSRIRPLRRAVRRLSWRRDDVDRVRARAEALRDRLASLQAQVAELSQAVEARGR